MDNLANIVSKTAPLLGSVLNSVLPGSGLIVSGLSSLFGLTSNDPDELAKAIGADPEAILKLKQFEIEHQNDLAKIIATDRASARERQVEMAKAGARDWVMDFLAVFVTLAFVCLCFVIAFADIKPDEKDLFYMLLGTFSTVWGGIVAFYFGGSPASAHPKPKPHHEPEVVLPPPAQTR